MTRYTTISVSEELLAELNELKGKKSHTEFISGLIHREHKVDQIAENTLLIEGLKNHLIEISKFLDRSSNGQFSTLTAEDFKPAKPKEISEELQAAGGYRRIEFEE